MVQSRQEQHQPSLQPHSHTTPELAQRTRQRREQRRTLSVTVRFHVPPHPTLTQRVCHLLTAMHSHYCGCLCAFTTTSLTKAMIFFYTRCTLGLLASESSPLTLPLRSKLNATAERARGKDLYHHDVLPTATLSVPSTMNAATAACAPPPHHSLQSSLVLTLYALHAGLEQERSTHCPPQVQALNVTTEVPSRSQWTWTSNGEGYRA